MTESQLRQRVVDVMRGWLGWSEANGKHRAIIDLYNTQRPLPRGYAVRYDDEWCATCVTAAGIQAGLRDIILGECSCSRMISLYRARGQWMEDDGYRPRPGDIIMYDWQDTGKGDNTGAPDHVGVVAEINGDTMTIMEGNKGEAVARRTLAVNGRYIRGYCLPDYAGKATGEEDDTMTYEQWVEYMELYRKEQAAKEASAWAQKAGTLAKAKAAGISDGTRPRDLMTREEGMAMCLGAVAAAALQAK